LPAPADAAFVLVSSRARRLTSIACTVARGAESASATAIGPYPQPRSSRSPVVSGSGSGALRRRIAVPGSSRSAEKTPEDDANRSRRPATLMSICRLCAGDAGSALK
jgi:hypothetical protein